jgi:site-specific DNA recombinase
MMRAAIYARFSSDNQRDTSIDDQIAAARSLARQLGADVVQVYSDFAVSGTRRDREAFLAMQEGARAALFDCLLLWDLKRLSRAEDLPQLLAQLKFRGLRVVTCDGFDSARAGAKVLAWANGMVGNLQLEQLAQDVHRGLTGQFTRGLSAGGLPYGYRSKATDRGQDLEIDPSEAEWVRWIYARYLDGWSPQRIAHELNARAVPSPRASQWAPAALYGHPKYQTGILRNPIYVGLYIWNRSRWIKDPDTGKRHRRERPESEWMRETREHLRIVSDPQWHDVARRIARGKGKKGRPARTALSGLMRCEECGGPIIAVCKYNYGCGWHKDRGPAVCSGVLVPRKRLEARVVEIAQAEWSSDDAIAVLHERAAQILADDVKRTQERGAPLRTRLATLDRAIARLVDAVAAAGWSQALAERLQAAESERTRLRAELADLPPETVAGTMVPRLVDRYRAMVNSLPELLQRDPNGGREAIRQCLGEIRLAKRQGGSVYAKVNALGVLLKLVAGDRFSISNQPLSERQYREYKIA